MSTELLKFDSEHATSAAAGLDLAEQLSRAALGRALDISPNAVFFLTSDLRIISANAAGVCKLGYSRVELASFRFVDVVSPADREPLIAISQRLLCGKRGALLATRLLGKGGQTFPVRLRVQLIDRSAEPCLVVVAQDKAPRRRRNESSARNASPDYVTGLPIRGALESHLRLAERRAKGRDGRFAVLFVDLDGFKHVNDACGHAVGDEVLRIVSERLTASVRPGDFVGRYGGDEFVVVIENVLDEAEVEAIAGRVRSELNKPAVIGKRRLEISASVGVAVGQPSVSARALVGEADEAMYRSKYDPLRRSVTETAVGFVQPSLAQAVKASRLPRKVSKEIADLTSFPEVSTP